MHKEKVKRYSGVSFGGIFNRVSIFGDRYYVMYGKFKNGYGYKVKKYNTWDKISQRFYLFFPVFDLLLIFGYIVLPMLITYISGNAEGPYIEISPIVMYIIVYVLPFIVVIFEFFLIYYLIMKGVRTWHGSEHKLISAMEDNNIDNAVEYDPIHKRCGGTLMPTIIFSLLAWLFISYYTGIPFGQFTFMTICIVLNIKVFHKYDKVGIWFGKWLQRKYTISEPEHWKLTLGRIAAKQLVKAEKGEEFREGSVLYG